MGLFVKLKCLKYIFSEFWKWLRVAGLISHFIFEISIEVVELVEWNRHEECFCTLRVSCASRSDLQFSASLSCFGSSPWFGSFLRNLRVVLGESLVDFWTLCTTFYLVKVFFYMFCASYDPPKPLPNIGTSTSSI